MNHQRTPARHRYPVSYSFSDTFSIPNATRREINTIKKLRFCVPKLAFRDVLLDLAIGSTATPTLAAAATNLSASPRIREGRDDFASSRRRRRRLSSRFRSLMIDLQFDRETGSRCATCVYRDYCRPVVRNALCTRKTESVENMYSASRRRRLLNKQLQIA